MNRKQSGSWLEQPQKVPASHGWQWIKSSIGMFLGNPWKWLAMGFCMVVIIGILNFIPLVGSFIAYLLGTVLTGGMMMAAQAQADGEAIRFSFVFKGFSHNRNQLLLIAVYYIAFMVLLGIVLVALFFLFFGSAIWNPQTAPMAFQQRWPLVAVLILLAAAVSIPMMMAFWFAVPLVAITDRTAWTACKQSFRGCVANWLAFLVYGLAFLVLGILSLIAFSAISGIMAFFLAQQRSFLVVLLPMAIMVLVWFPIMIITWLSIYTGFKDIYYRSI